MKKLILIFLFSLVTLGLFSQGAETYVKRQSQYAGVLTVARLTVTDTLWVTGHVSIVGSITISGTITVDSLIDTGGATFGNTITSVGVLDVQNTMTLGNDAANISGVINFVASDGDTGSIQITTGDQLTFTTFSGGYVFDADVKITRDADQVLQLGNSEAGRDHSILFKGEDTNFTIQHLEDEGQLSFSGTIKTGGGLIRNTTTVNTATYDLLVTDDILHVTYTGTGAVTSLTLPTAQAVDGRTIVIKDAGLNAKC